MPTLLAAAGTSPDAAYPSDGEDLGPIMTGRAAPHPRKFYWRYKAGSQRAIRDGNWKYFQADRYGVINPAPAAPSSSAPTK
jgi:arylsulfatase A-like enzyme